jgi:hypothetical protein
MSIKVAIGSKIYDISSFSEQDKDGLLKLSKFLNYRVNQVIAALKIYDQELAVVIAALSILDENEILKNNLNEQSELFPENGTYSKADMERILSDTISNLTKKLQHAIDKI